MSSSFAGSSADSPWWHQFDSIWDVDFEYLEDANHHPIPVCMHTREHHTGAVIQMWRDQLLACPRAPFATGPRDLMRAYASNAEFSCFLALGWPLPCNVLDLYVETIAAINGKAIEGLGAKRPKLPEALALFDLPVIMSASEKAEMIALILSRSNSNDYTEQERATIQNYNRVDVDEDCLLFAALAPSIDWPRALFRGRYMKTVAQSEWLGLPVDRYYLEQMVEAWDPIRRYFIERGDEFDLYDDLSFCEDRLQALIEQRGWDWPRTKTGKPERKLRTLGKQARRYPELKSLVRLQGEVAELKISHLANTVGADGFSRCPLLPFWTVTGRNQPGARDRIFLPHLPAWLHGLIAPPPGWAVAEVDWDGQEYALVATYSRDPAMLEDYLSGDPHTAFGIRAKLLPEGASKQNPEHRSVRDKICKPIVHGQNYGMTAYGIAAKTGKSLNWSRDVHARHRFGYPTFHQWRADTVAQARFDGVIYSPYGWPQHIAGKSNNSLKNFPGQAGGADMMRIVMIAATEAGIKICCPVHDAFWIMAPIDEMADTIAHMKEIMVKASLAITDDLPIGVTVEAEVRSPQCLGDIRVPTAKGQGMWLEVKELVAGQLRATGS